MIKARNIIKSYQNGESRFQVLKDISLDIEDRGESEAPRQELQQVAG